MPTRVYIIEDAPSYRAHLAAVISATPGFSLVGSSDSIPKKLQPLKTIDPDVLLLDLELGTTCALDSLLDLREALERTRIVILSSHHDDLRVFKALEHGADAYLVKASTPPAELLGAIEKVCQGEAPLSGSVARRVIESFRKQRADQIALESLTQRESQTFDLLATGASNREIAQEMNIAEGTVRTHVHNVLRKLHVSTRTRAIRAASRRIR